MTCQKVAKKEHRIGEMVRKIERWRREGDRVATIEKTEEDIATLWRAIDKATEEHDAKNSSLS